MNLTNLLSSLALLVFLISFNSRSRCNATASSESSVSSVSSASDEISRPNILFFLVDDWGFNDVAYNENTYTKTPFIAKLAKEESLIIAHYYTMPLCTISRSALLTGRYPMRFGLQTEVIGLTANYALTRHEYLLSNEFQYHGYDTHMVGKWHLGILGWDYVPINRGFDSFFGYYGGELNYYNHTSDQANFSAKDFHLNSDFYEDPGRYSLNIYEDHVTKLIKSFENINNPFFLYVAWQGSHLPSMAPENYSSLYANESEDARKYFQAQTTMTDDILERYVTQLKVSSLWDNTLLVFASDNGAETDTGDNSPLRGAKSTIWEGGVRVPAFVTGGYLPHHLRGKTFDHIAVHVIDWYPTLIAACGLSTTTTNPLDGANLWSMMLDTNRDEKLIQLDQLDGTQNGKQNVLALEEKVLSDEELDEHVSLGAMHGDLTERFLLLNAETQDCETDVCGALVYAKKWKIFLNSESSGSWVRDYARSEYDDVLGCGGVPDNYTSTEYCAETACLFDLENDPCEYYDVYQNNSVVAENLLKVLTKYYKMQVPDLIDTFGSVSNGSDFLVMRENGFYYWTPYYMEGQWRSMEFEEYLTSFYNSTPNDTSDASELIGADGEVSDGSAHTFWRDFVVRKMLFNSLLFYVFFGLFVVCLGVCCVHRVSASNSDHLKYQKCTGNPKLLRQWRQGRRLGTSVEVSETTVLLMHSDDFASRRYGVNLNAN